MTAIDLPATLARLDAAPNIGTQAGQAVLAALVNAGRAYDSAGKPDVLQESAAHQRWAGLRPSQRIGQAEPEFYVAAYYRRLASTRASGPIALTPDQLPRDQRQSYNYWANVTSDPRTSPKDVEIGTAFMLLVRAAANARE